jgi:hypothetical protein
VSQNLPNEVEKEAPTEVTKTRDGQASQTCDKQAEKFNGYKRKEYSKETYPPSWNGYTNHYDAGTSRCYVEVGFDYGGARRKYFVYDASVEGDGSPLYGS